MNRVILIGNGFDLAHGMPTRYEDFINWYFNGCLNSLAQNGTREYKDILLSLKLSNNIVHRNDPIMSSWAVFFRYYMGNLSKKESAFELILDLIKDGEFCSGSFSTFFKQICYGLKTKRWVDIENEYYEFLIQYAIINKNVGGFVKDLNKQMIRIQKLLVCYLNSLKCPAMNKYIRSLIYEPIKAKDIAVAAQEKLVNHFRYWIQQSEDTWREKLQQYEFSADSIQKAIDWRTDVIGYGETKVYDEPEIETLARYNEYFPHTGLFPDKILLLSFNYTENIMQYFIKKRGCFQLNYIHGRLDYPGSIIFGYGGELEEQYNKLLSLNDKECLNGFKAFKYLESSNYRDMLSFIESAPYQVYIMGHSCGTSDRTLLNTLFEHRNCVTIKPFYYKKNDGTDDYLDIVQNIARSFTNMKRMRDRVVNKTFCTPLPQSK